MQVVQQKLEESIPQKLMDLPVDFKTAVFIGQAEANYARTRISKIHKSTGVRFRTKKARTIIDGKIIEGINIWKISDGNTRQSDSN